MLPNCIGNMQSYTSFNMWRIADLKRMPFWDCFLKIVLLLWQHGQKQQKKRRSKNNNSLSWLHETYIPFRPQPTNSKQIETQQPWETVFLSLSINIVCTSSKTQTSGSPVFKPGTLTYKHCVTVPKNPTFYK